MPESRCLNMALNSSILDCSNYSTINIINNEKQAADLLFSPIEVVLSSIIVPCIMAASLLSNSAFIFTVYRQSELHTITNAYLVNLAVADLLFVQLDGIGHFVLPYMKSEVKTVHNGQFECLFRVMFSNMCYYTSFVLVTCVAVERFVAISYPLHQQIVSGKSRTIKIIISSWLLGGIFAAVLHVPRLAHLKKSCIVWPDGDKYLMLPKKRITCEQIPGFPIRFGVLADGILYMMALIINFTLYTKIIVTLKTRACDNLGTHISLRQVHNQVVRLLIMNGAVFFVSFTPWQIANLNNIFIHLFESHLFSNMHFQLLLKIGLCLNYINSTINPFVYMACSFTYRNAYLKAFGVKRRR